MAVLQNFRRIHLLFTSLNPVGVSFSDFEDYDVSATGLYLHNSFI